MSSIIAEQLLDIIAEYVWNAVMMEALNTPLNKYMDEEVRLPQEGRVESRRIVWETIDSILNGVKEIDARFDFDCVKTGSDHQNIAITDSDFDVALVFKHEPVREFCPSFTQTGYTDVKLTDMRNILKWRDMSCVIITPYQYHLERSFSLSSTKLLNRFYRYIVYVITQLNLSRVRSVSIHGPAVTMTIEVNNIICSLDMTIALPFTWPVYHTRRNFAFVGDDEAIRSEGILVVPKSPAGETNMEWLWYASFVKAENALIRMPDPGCCRKSLRICKSLLKGIKIGSYPIKNIWLNQCETLCDENWREDNLGRRVFGLIAGVKQAIACQRCPTYFIPSINCLAKFSQSELNVLEEQVDCIIHILQSTAWNHILDRAMTSVEE